MKVRLAIDGKEIVKFEAPELNMLERCRSLGYLHHKLTGSDAGVALAAAVDHFQAVLSEDDDKGEDEDGGEPTTEQLRGV